MSKINPIDIQESCRNCVYSTLRENGNYNCGNASELETQNTIQISDYPRHFWPNDFDQATIIKCEGFDKDEQRVYDTAIWQLMINHDLAFHEESLTFLVKICERIEKIIDEQNPYSVTNGLHTNRNILKEIEDKILYQPI